MNPHTKAQRLAASTTVTGSIVAVMSTVNATVINSCSFGNFVQTSTSASDFTLISSSIHQNVTDGTTTPLTTGEIFNGPLTSFELNNKAGVIVYYNGDIKVTT